MAEAKLASGDAAVAGVTHYDLPTLDKIPVIRRLMGPTGDGLALDIGIGTGYTTSQVFGDTPTVCLDLHAPNLRYYQKQREAAHQPASPLCIVAPATSLPLKDGSVRYVLCSEVLEHLEDDETAVAEIARVLSDDGRAVITVPYTGIGFTSFLERFHIKTVHDFPGPEFHVRPGYDEKTLAALFARHGLELDAHDFYLRFFTRLVVDGVSLSHIAYQRIRHGRRSWTWSDATEVEGSLPFRIYTLLFPLMRGIARADALLGKARGFGIVARARKRPPTPKRAGH
ncbi:MAG TPA: class I SAM-dependent methyltransferase [Dehalococcoidia bacterium]|nr:class I SAM-dependent methyltransferase [Dehalococcoidia bacterium]